MLSRPHLFVRGAILIGMPGQIDNRLRKHYAQKAADMGRGGDTAITRTIRKETGISVTARTVARWRKKYNIKQKRKDPSAAPDPALRLSASGRAGDLPPQRRVTAVLAPMRPSPPSSPAPQPQPPQPQPQPPAAPSQSTARPQHKDLPDERIAAAEPEDLPDDGATEPQPQRTWPLHEEQWGWVTQQPPQPQPHDGAAEPQPHDGAAEPQPAPAAAEPRGKEPAGPLGVPGGPPENLSPVSAETFDQCPRRWRFQNVDGIPTIPSAKAQAGSFADRVLEMVMTQPADKRTTDEARRLARDVWPEIEQSEDFVALGLDDEQAKQFRWHAWRSVEGIWALEDPADVQVESTEREMSATLAGVPFKGTVNRAERTPEGLVITDYRSEQAPRREYAGRPIQRAMLYAAAVAEQTGEMPARVQIQYLGQRTISTPVTQERVRKAVRHLKSTWAAVQEACGSDDFATRPGPLCATCAFRVRCPEGQREATKLQASRAAREATRAAAAAASPAEASSGVAA